MKCFLHRSFPLFILSLLIILGGCAHYGDEKSIPAIIATSEAFKSFSGEYENTAYFKRYKPSSIAVLPFENLTGKSYSIDLASENPTDIVRRGMYNHVSSLPFTDLEIYQTEKRLKNAGLDDIQKVDDLIANNPKKLMSILGVDAVISGKVTHFDRIFLGIYSQVAVGGEVKMWDLKTGNLLWRAKQVSRAHAGGISLNPIGLITSTVAAVWNLRKSEMLGQTDALFREVVSTMDIPESVLAAQPPAPRVDFFAVLNSEKPYRAGDRIGFRIIGDPGSSAYVDLGDYKMGLEVRPVSPPVKQALQAEVLGAIKKNYKDTGHELTPELVAAVEKELVSREVYEGSYMVSPGEESYGLLAKAYLVNPAGAQTATIDAVHTVDIDSLPPGETTSLQSMSLDNKIKLQWAANLAADLSKYEVWSSPSPISGYALNAKSEKNEALIENVANFTRVYFKVRAIDKAANAGNFSPPVEAVPLPEPDLYGLPQPGPALGGEVNNKVLLVAEKNPYTVLADLFVTPGGVLYIEPGVKILFAADTALTIDGGDLLAYGIQDNPIYLGAKADGSSPGAWRGVFLEGAKRAVLRHVSIEKAETGLSIKNSAPTVTGLRITRSAQAGIYLKDNAKPNITCSYVTDNEGQGAVVVEGEGLSPVIRQSVFLNNNPFQVQSYTPFQLDFSDNYWGQPLPDAASFLGNVIWKPALSEAPLCTAK
ncbi:MAG: DUF799 family lipoprotein [Desulfobacterales bacterium]|nr:DUF799 family lipoprotein [Desulfobacterales bacterium]